MDNLIAKIDDARRSWDDDATYLLAKNKKNTFRIRTQPFRIITNKSKSTESKLHGCKTQLCQ